MLLRSSFCAVACALLLASCATHAPDTTPRPPHKLLLVSIDGLRADALDRGITPALARMSREGVRARWMTPSYPSLTFPNHYTLVTGLRPDHHGIVHNTMRDAELGGFWLSKADAVGDARWWGGEPIWVGAEKAGIRSATWSWPGSEAPIAGVRPSQWLRYDGRVPALARVDTVLDWFRQTGPDAPRLLTLYFDQVDHAGHDHGPDSPEYAAAVRGVDAALAHLLDGLAQQHVLDDTDIVVVSDHGMAEVAPTHLLPVDTLAPPALVEVVSDGQVVELQPRPGREAEAVKALVGRHDHYSCWERQALPARWQYGSNPRIPPIVCQMDEGWDAVHDAKIAKREAGATRGSHGYDPALPSMRAVFVARGPSFAQGRELAPFDNVDVYPLLTRLLGIPAAPNDGDPQVLLPALRNAP